MWERQRKKIGERLGREWGEREMEGGYVEGERVRIGER